MCVCVCVCVCVCAFSLVLVPLLLLLFPPNFHQLKFQFAQNKSWSGFSRGSKGSRLRETLLGMAMGVFWFGGNILYGVGVEMIGSLGTVLKRKIKKLNIWMTVCVCVCVCVCVALYDSLTHSRTLTGARMACVYESDGYFCKRSGSDDW